MRTFPRLVLAIIFVGLTGGLVPLGVWARGRDSGAPVIRLEDGRDFVTLVSRIETDNTATYGPTGQRVPFLDESDMNVLDLTGRYLFTSHETRRGAGVTRIDLREHTVDVILEEATFQRFDGLLWTPWDTLLVGEETNDGRLLEIVNPLAAPADVAYLERPAFGQRRHEGLALDWRGYLYGVDEDTRGSVYRFRPDSPLTREALSSGTLEVLVLLEDREVIGHRRVKAAWRQAGGDEGSRFDRPEDVELVGTTLYVAVSGEHRVLSIDVSGETDASVGILVGNKLNAESLDWPDNLASDSQGGLYIAEDISGRDLLGGKRNQVWYVTPADDPLAPADSVRLFATVESPRDEPSGLLVDAAGEQLYMNLMGPNGSILQVPLR